MIGNLKNYGFDSEICFQYFFKYNKYYKYMIKFLIIFNF